MTRRQAASAPAATPVHPDALCVIVYRGTDALLVLDEGGRVLAPVTMHERAPVAVALAQASAALANLPIPHGYRELLCTAADRLAAIGTPAAREALEALEVATRHQSEAYDAAVALADATSPVQ